MRTLIAFLLLLLTSSAFAQDLELVEALHHKGSYPTANCPKDANGEYCTIIDVILPGVKIYNIECSNKVGHEEEIPNGKRFFMSVPQKKQKVRVNAMGYQPSMFEVKADEVSKIEVYEIRLRVPSFVPPSPNKKEKMVWKEVILNDGNRERSGIAYSPTLDIIVIDSKGANYVWYGPLDNLQKSNYVYNNNNHGLMAMDWGKDKFVATGIGGNIYYSYNCCI